MTREAIASYEAGRSQLMVSTMLDIAAALRISINEIIKPDFQATEVTVPRRWAKRMDIIEGLPESMRLRRALLS
jgi:transcriptional regulator with XRE-family HTH domain